MDRATLGKLGEKIAARYLESLGYVIKENRVRYGGAETDLIAEKGGEVVFVEVKTRADERYGRPEEAVTFAKRQRLRLAAYAYAAAQRTPPARLRIDVIAVIVSAGRASLRHYRNAVGEEG